MSINTIFTTNLLKYSVHDLNILTTEDLFMEKPKPRLSWLSKFLTLWIFLAMISGVSIGYIYPNTANVIGSFSIGTTSIPIAIGLIWMMFPPLSRVRYEDLRKVVTAKGSGKMLTLNAVLAWVVGPLLMFALAWVFLPGYPEFRTGLILVGLAPCIAMVIVWNTLADGDNEWIAIFVALNSIFQILAYSVLAYFYITVASGWISGAGMAINISLLQVAESVAIYLGIPFFAGVIVRYYFLKTKRRKWFETKLAPKLGHTSLIALLFTIVVMFSLKGQYIVNLPLDVVRIALPLLAYFIIMFFGAFAIGHYAKLGYKRTTSLSFTAASNNFELAIAVAVAVFGLASKEAFASVIGPLIEVPIMVSLVNAALWFRKKYFSEDKQ